MPMFENLGKKKVVLGMVHLGALPGTPFYGDGSYEAVEERAVADARALEAGGADGCVVQNAGDRVFAIDDADPVIVVGMTDIVRAIREATGPAFQIGVQILRNDLKGALAIAHVCGGSFLRCGALVGSTITASGLMQGDPYEFQAYRSRIGATGVKLIAEIYSMHFEWLGGKPVGDVARAARHAGADAVSLCDPDDDRTERFIQEVRAAAPGHAGRHRRIHQSRERGAVAQGRGRGDRGQRVRGREPVRDGAGGGGAGVRGDRVAACRAAISAPQPETVSF